MKRSLGLAVLAAVATTMMAFGTGCDSDSDEGDDGQYCAYEVGLYEDCDISWKSQAPQQEVCTEFLAACNRVSAWSGCVHVSGRSICTKNCSKYTGCPNGGTCNLDAGYCVP